MGPSPAQIGRWIGYAFAGLLGLVVLAYAIDYGVWKYRQAHGTGTGSVTVGQVTVAGLKGSKEMYYSDGQTDQACSRSVFPQEYDPCWWVQRHREVLVKY